MKKYVFSTLHCKDIQKFCKNKIIKKKNILHGGYYALGFISPLRVKHVKRERGRKEKLSLSLLHAITLYVNASRIKMN